MLRRYMTTAEIPRGWISPTGEFTELHRDAYHSDVHPIKIGEKNVTSNEMEEREKKAFDAGWIASGHGGFPIAYGSAKVMFDPNHPANKTFRKLLSEHDFPTERIHFRHPEDNNKLTVVDKQDYIKNGTKPGFLKEAVMRHLLPSPIVNAAGHRTGSKE